MKLGQQKEAQAVKTIAQRGVVVIGTAHGSSLASLLKNPELNLLVGGVSSVLIGDRLAERSAYRRRSQWDDDDPQPLKTTFERGGAPTFSIILELVDVEKWVIHLNTADSVDRMLTGGSPPTQTRYRHPIKRTMSVKYNNLKALELALSMGLCLEDGVPRMTGATGRKEKRSK